MTSEELAFGFEWWFTGGSESPRKDCFAKSFFGPDGLKGSEERTVYVVLASLLPAALVRAHTAVFQHLLAFSLELQTSCFRASPLIENWEDKQPESFGSLHRINFRAPQLICLRLPVNMCISASAWACPVTVSSRRTCALL